MIHAMIHTVTMIIHAANHSTDQRYSTIHAANRSTDNSADLIVFLLVAMCCLTGGEWKSRINKGHHSDLGLINSLVDVSVSLCWFESWVNLGQYLVLLHNPIFILDAKVSPLEGQICPMI